MNSIMHGPTSQFARASRLRRSALVVSAITLCCLTAAQAQLVVNVGDRLLPPNTTTTLDLTVQNPSAAAVEIGGLNFNLELESTGPAVQNVDLKNGTIFDSTDFASQSNLDTLDPDHQRAVTIVLLTDPGATPFTLDPGASEIFAKVAISTAGFSSGGPWSMNLEDTFNLATTFLDSGGNPITATITDGTLTVVPEPNASLVVAGLLLGAAAFARRWRAAR